MARLLSACDYDALLVGDASLASLGLRTILRENIRCPLNTALNSALVTPDG